jgi:hypothetical protein
VDAVACRQRAGGSYAWIGTCSTVERATGCAILSLLRNSPCSPFRRRWLTREGFISSGNGRAGALEDEEVEDGAVKSFEDVKGLRE